MEDEEHDESIKEFPGLFVDEPNYDSESDNDLGESGSEKAIRKDILKTKKEKNKDISYSTLDGESSAEEMDLFDSKSSGKCKKTKSFKFLQKKEKDEKDDKKRKDDKDDKKKEKRKEKECRKREKEEKRKIKKDKKKKFLQDEEDYLPIFGVPLSLAVDRCPSHDGIRLPAIVRQCIDFIEEKGLCCEGIYRIGGVKSKVQSLRNSINSGEVVQLDDQHPHVVASLLKQYLSELPETVLTVDMMPHFEDVSLIPNPKERAEAMRQLIDRLPTTNRLLLQYMLKHMGNVIEKEQENKMSYQNICVVLSPTIQISHRVLNVMFHGHNYLFGKVVIKKYVPPITSSSTDLRSIEELNSPKLIEEELNKQDSLLASLHAAVASGRISQKTEEQLWEAQRNHTLLKRRLKMYERRDSTSNGGSGSSQERLNSQNDFQYESHISYPERMGNSNENIDVEVSPVKLPSEVPQKIKPPETFSCKSTAIVEKMNNNNSNELSLAQDNVTVISIEKFDSEKAADNFKNDKIVANITSSKEISIPVTVPLTKEVIIPVLPKPISVKAVRSKMAPEIKESSSPLRDMLGNAKSSTQFADFDKCSNTGKTEIIVPFASESISSSVTTISSCNQDHLSKDIEQNKIQIYFNNANSNSRTTEHQMKKLNSEATVWSEPDFLILLKEELRLQYEHEERLAMNQELTKKLKVEKSEISRLKDEIQEIQTIYGYRTHSYDSSESDGTDSDGDSDSEEDILTQISSLDLMNEKIHLENTSLVKKIRDEREAVIHLKVALREVKSQQNRLFQQVPKTVVAS